LRKADPALDTQLSTLETNLCTATTEADKQRLKSEIQTHWREAYKKQIETADPSLAQILQKLREHDFDYSTLDPADLQALITNTTAERIDIAIQRGLSRNLIGGDKTLKEFFQQLSDPAKKEISIGGMSIPVEKKLRT